MRDRRRVAAVLTGVLVGIAVGCSGGDPVDVTSSGDDAAVISRLPATTEPLVIGEPVGPSDAIEPTPVEVATPAPSPPPTGSSTELPSAEPEQASTTAPSAAAAPDAVGADSPTAVPAPTVAPQSPLPDQSDGALVANGGEVYTLSCARCHAENGLGDAGSGAYGAPLIGVGSRYSTDALIAELTSGHPVTFGFADRLSPTEIAAVAAYVRAAFP